MGQSPPPPPPTDSSSTNHPPDATPPAHDTPPTTEPSTPKTPAPDAKTLKRKLSLEAKLANLRAQIQELKARRDELRPQLRNPDAAMTVKRHIRLLHDYNEIRDIGTGLMGMAADSRGVRVRDVYAEFGVEVND
ncbi:hypothetical protein FGG08_004707 [Glutinoglossum americanum]|uniref:DNA repair protein Swi5/Sae3 n=1 Tax=Glutinoglossum americanum TaxID=1670608 RepID=A0A9P8KZA9_9PEZI|nr:hypothetical protein FGG08_004707 [Glutinoglossum americanum]